MSKYPQEIIKEAQELFELGLTYEAIAAKLGLPRAMTVYDWKSHYGWTRTGGITDQETLRVFQDLHIKAKEYLKEADFGSITEALKVYERTGQALKAKEIQPREEDEGEKFLDVLDIEARIGRRRPSSDKTSSKPKAETSSEDQ